MSAVLKLLSDCRSAGIQLTPIGSSDLKIDAPQNSLTPELIEQLKANKADVLRTLRVFRCDEIEEDWPDTVDVRDTTPCPKCGSLELWENLVGNWRCLRCDPPTRWRQFAARHRIYD